MKKITTRLMALSFALMSVPVFGQLLIPEVLYFKFDGSGTSVPNYASAPPAGSNPSTINGLTQGASSLCGGSLIGNGLTSTSNYVNTNWATSFSTNWTISFRTNNIISTTSTYYILGDVNAGGIRCFTGGVAGAGNWILRGPLTDVLVTGGASTTATMTTFVYDQAAGNIKAYLNGVLVNTVVQSPITVSGTGPFKVGGYSSSACLPSGGEMDEFRLYSRALTQAEITQLYNPWTPSGFLGSDVNFCGGSVQIDMPDWPYSNALWSSGSTGDSTLATSTGQVTVSVSGSCGSGNDTVQVLNGETSSSFSVNACTIYTAPSGATYSSSGTYMDTIPNSNGCDSVMTIQVTVTPPATYSFSVVSCMSYTAPSGAVYTTSGTYMDTIPNASGCDSVMTITATIGGPSMASFSAAACDMYMLPSGAIVMSTGTYNDTIPNIYGCDSVMTFQVMISNSTSASVTASACNMYIAPSGAVYTVSGTYMDTISNMAGCDSIVTIQVTINNSTTASINASGCNSYTAPSGAVFTSSGTYMDTISNMAGCDSVITIALNVTTVNAGATVSGAVCTATGTTAGATFQWINCSNMAPIGGATNISYTATTNGNYAVIITIGSCSDTSSCVAVTGIGIEENAFGSAITLYPNPNSGNFTINMGATYDDITVVITDLAGRVVFTQAENSAEVISVQLEAPAGAYVITIVSGDNQANIRMIKE